MAKMTLDEAIEIEELFQSGDIEIAFHDDFRSGSVQDIQEGVAFVMNFRTEEEYEIELTKYSIDNFEVE